MRRSYDEQVTSTSEQTQTERYEPGAIEQRWRQRWEDSGLYRTEDHVEGRDNWYALTMLPYTSGDLHVGHWFAMAPSDALARFRRMRGYNVLFPIGFDAFGLPAENAAIAGGAHPKDWTDGNIVHMREQLKRMGTMFDWTREVDTSSPDYYRWTQWWFLQLHRQGLAYRADAPVNWCPSCNTVLANEQVHEGVCERCNSAVEQRAMEQWFFRSTNYAEELLANEDLEWPDYVKLMQRNWIGRSEGAEASFALETPAPDGTDEIRVFTTRPDTLHGVTFMVLAPGAPAGLADHHRGAALRGGSLRTRRRARLRDRAAGGRSREDRRLHGRLLRQPPHGRPRPDLDRRLRPRDLRDGRGDGRARARPARLRVRGEVRAARPDRDRAAGLGRRAADRGLRRGRARWSTPGASTACPRRRARRRSPRTSRRGAGAERRSSTACATG